MERLTEINTVFEDVIKHLGTDKFTLEDLQAIETTDVKLQEEVKAVIGLYGRGATYEEFRKYYDSQAKNKNYDLEFNSRLIVGDNPEDIKDVVYGNAFVIGSVEEESHGTHVSGIILANRNNNIGMKGVANNAKLMSVRAVPDGDERDKDVALAIRYAVDNGAKVINMSFGKSWSPNPEWVFEAFKYAEKNDVLLVHAAGNDAKDIDVKDNWPNDTADKINEMVDNVITVGAMSSNYDENLPATFSNYGQKNVDIFAPGVQIYSTIPNNEYARYNGTSMASPEVAGVATLIRSYYPQLSASQVKHIIMNSGTPIEMDVLIPGKDGEKAKLSTLSISGKVLNAYNALVLADKMVNKK
jgi:subtilisin family serine protease